MSGYFRHLLLNSTSWALESSGPGNTGAADDILVGGQAVIEGVMMRSPQGYSVAVRRQDGSFQVIKAPLKTAGEKWKVFKLPVLRGVGVLGQAMVLGIKALRFSADAAMEDAEAAEVQAVDPAPSKVTAWIRMKSGIAASFERFIEKRGSWLIGANMVLALGFNILLFVVLPLFAMEFIKKQAGFESQLASSAVEGVFRVLIFVGFISAVSLMKDMRRVFEYHGAEHKTVFAFESRKPVNVPNARKFSTLHPRCGTSFLLVVMIVSIVVFSIFHFPTITGRLLSRIVLLPLVAGLSYEVIRYSAKHPTSLLRWVTFPGLMLQKITTKEPDEPQLETAIRALEEALTV